MLLDYFVGFLGFTVYDRRRFESFCIEDIMNCLGFCDRDISYVCNSIDTRIVRVNYQKQKSIISKTTMDHINNKLNGYVIGPKDKNANSFFIL